MRGVPDDFQLLEAGVLVRRGYEAEFAAWRECARRADGAPGGSAYGGRGGLATLALGDGARVFVRRYRHGGLLGSVLGEAYFGRPPRPWRELVVTESARRLGIIAPEVLAAAAEPFERAVAGLPYRSFLVTRALEGRRSLGEVLCSARTDERVRWLAVVVAAVRHLHALGIRHPDLNVSNLLVDEAAAASIAFIDFDRAVAGTQPVSWPARRLARRRLARSVAKLRLSGLSREECGRLLADIDLEDGR